MRVFSASTCAGLAGTPRQLLSVLSAAGSASEPLCRPCSLRLSGRLDPDQALAAVPAARRGSLPRHLDQVVIRVGIINIVTGATALRPGCDPERAAATFFALVNSHSYQLLAEHLGWDVAEWQRWLTGILGRELFGASE
jgi:hypothetical protein